MKKFVTLSMSCGTEYVASESDDAGEDDGITAAPAQRDLTKPCRVDVHQIRNFYPRKEPRVGTRVLFNNGSALAVTELMDEVARIVDEALAA